MRYIWIIFIILSSANLFAQTIFSDSMRVSRLEDAWLVFDKKHETYLPYLSKIHGQVNKLHLLVDSSLYRKYYLFLEGKKGSHLFINNNLSYSFLQNQNLYLNMDSLVKVLRNKVLLFTYYNPLFIENIPQASIYMKPPNHSQDLLESKGSSFKKKREQKHRDFLVLTSILVLVVMSIIKKLYQNRQDFFSIIKYLSNFFKPNFQIKKLQILDFLWFLVYYGLSISFIILFLASYSSNNPNYRYFLNEYTYLSDSFQQLFSVFFVVVLAILFQCILVWLVGTLYHDQQIIAIHLHQYVEISQFFCTIIVMIMMLANTIVFKLSPIQIDFLAYFFIVMFVLRTVLITYRLSILTEYKKIYLFAYLCSTEFIPMLLLAKFFI